jgi:regulator of protease activity HflC (stomatin/prohibitin superfamily)
VVDVFGRVAEEPRHAGINLVNPFAQVQLLSIKTQEIKETMSVPSQEGLGVSLDVSVLYRLEDKKAPEIYRTVGMNYADVVLVPQFRSVGRGVTVNYEAKALYTASREQIASQFQEQLQGLVSDRGIVIERVALRDIELPRTVGAAIELKLQAEQEAEKMKFVLLKEQQEAERKRIEAEGIREFQKIVTEGITTSLLHWKGIEATKALAESPNTKVIIFGNSQTGLPLVFDAQRFTEEGQ